MPLSPGQILNNRYRIVSELGSGGFGAVHKAWDLHLNIACAVKENFETSESAVRQFEREATFLAVLHHPSLPRVIDHFSLPGQGQYLVMDYIEGKNLQAIVDHSPGPLPEADVVSWITQIGSALGYLHAQNPPIIHRDIKPANIIVRPDGTAVLVDFGIAKAYQPGDHTTHGARGITPGYSPPEQYGKGRTDGRTDIYALGATAYMLLTRQDPPESVELLRGAEKLISLRTLTPRVSPYLITAVERAMQLDPARRFARAADFHAALSTPGKLTRVPPQKPFPWLWVAIGAAASLLVLAVLAVGLILIANSDQSTPSPGETVRDTSPEEELPAPTRTPRREPEATPYLESTPVLPAGGGVDTPPPPEITSTLVFAEMDIDIWPEYDRPGVLVILHINLAADAPLPADLAIRIPASAGDPFAVAGIQTNGTLGNITFTRQVDGEWATIYFTTSSRRIQLEYYDDTLQISGDQRSFEFIWPVDYPVAALSVQVQQPFDATSMVIAPSFGSGVVGGDGLTYYDREYGQMEAGQIVGISLAYNKPSDTISVVGMISTPIPTAVPTPVPSSTPSAAAVSLAYVKGAVGDTDIYLTNSSGSSTTCVACASCDQSDPDFSPDGRYIIYQADCGGTYDIWRVPVSGGSPQQMTSTSGYHEREPSYSPDGSLIAYQRLPSSETNRNTAGELMVMDTNRDNSRSLGLTGRNPVFSPDGSRLAYMSDISGRWQIYIYTFATSTNQQLTNCATHCRWPEWSPDGQVVAYNTTVSVSSMDPDGIEYIPAEGGTPVTLIRDEACGRPAWSESDWIAFNSDRGIEAIHPDGTGRTVLVNLSDAWGPAYSR